MQFFLSIKTAFALFLIAIVIVFIGSLTLPYHLAFFSGIDETPLFRWLADAGKLHLTWWIYALICILAFTAVSTIFCTVEALVKKTTRKNFILKLSPQIMHIGVLFIMLGHLLTASIGLKTDLLIKKAAQKRVADTIGISVEDVKVETDEQGYYTAWEATVVWSEEGLKEKKKTLRPVHPVYFGEFGLFIKSVTIEPEASALIRVIRDPGAVWALLGGILLALGGAGFMFGKYRSLG
jgi:hypothetical protein